MITSTVITIVCNSCSKSSFVAKGDASFSKGNAYAAAFKDGWKYQSAEIQICPECQEKDKAAKAAAKPAPKAKAEKVAKTGKAAKLVDRKTTTKSGVKVTVGRVRVDPKHNGADKSAAAKVAVPGAISTGKLAKSAKKQSA